MKRLSAMIFCTVALFSSFGLAYADDPISISAKGVCVMDADTGKVIISRNADLRLPPASCTKVMTAIITLERAKLTDTFLVSPRAATMSPSKVYLRPGDKVTVEALLYSLLLKSANDSASVLAEGVAGTELEFARMMTEKAHQIGAVDTNFSNASGLPVADHYTTAYDLALILRYAMHDERFMAIASTKFATLNMGEKEKMLLKNHNKMLWNYEGDEVGKTGYTVAARQCYVGEANCSNTRLIVAVLHSNDLWGDTRKLLDEGFKLAMTNQTLALADIKGGDGYIQKASYKTYERVTRHRHSRKKHSRKHRRHHRHRRAS
jgi:serine-type D-Ala-D-Ala carboxypeptidase (penicillin-binding protein 5/6)